MTDRLNTYRNGIDDLEKYKALLKKDSTSFVSINWSPKKKIRKLVRRLRIQTYRRNQNLMLAIRLLRVKNKK